MAGSVLYLYKVHTVPLIGLRAIQLGDGVNALDSLSVSLIHYGQNMDYLESTTMETIVLSICWKWVCTIHNKDCDSNGIHTCSVMDGNCNLQCPKVMIHNWMCRNAYCFTISPKISHHSQGIHHYILNLWKFCAYSIIRDWHHETSPDYNLSAKTKWQKYVTQDAVPCDLTSHRKSATFV